LNEPEERGKTRIFRVSSKLVGILQGISKEQEFIFGSTSVSTKQSSFKKQTKGLAQKLANPRLNHITFHTFRHWIATKFYHQTKDPHYVKDFLGREKLRNTEIYINIGRTTFEPTSEELTVKIAEKPEEVKALLEVGSEYVCQKDNLIFLRKAK
jgi:integrase